MERSAFLKLALVKSEPLRSAFIKTADVKLPCCKFVSKKSAFSSKDDEKFTPIFDAIQDKADYLPLFSAFSICYEIIDTFRNRAHDNSRTSCTEAMQINNFYDAKIESIDACRNLVSDKIKANNLI